MKERVLLNMGGHGSFNRQKLKKYSKMMTGTCRLERVLGEVQFSCVETVMESWQCLGS